MRCEKTTWQRSGACVSRDASPGLRANTTSTRRELTTAQPTLRVSQSVQIECCSALMSVVVTTTYRTNLV
mgnify:CR=1 FL=1